MKKTKKMGQNTKIILLFFFSFFWQKQRKIKQKNRKVLFFGFNVSFCLLRSIIFFKKNALTPPQFTLSWFLVHIMSSFIHCILSITLSTLTTDMICIFKVSFFRIFTVDALLREETVSRLSEFAEINNDSIACKLAANPIAYPLWCSYREKQNEKEAAYSNNIRNFDSILEDNMVEPNNLENSWINLSSLTFHISRTATSKHLLSHVIYFR